MLHPFGSYCYDIDELVGGCRKMSTFMRVARKQAERNPDYFDPDKYFGDAFEAFVESLILQLGNHPTIQIKGYQPIVGTEDLGVDGYGYGPDGSIHTVQAKARGNTESLLTANRDHISNFYAHSNAKFGREYKVKYMTLFTTARDLGPVAREMYDNEMRVIGNNTLRKLVDNNEMFWVEFRDQLQLKHK